MRTIDKIITNVSSIRGAPMGRISVGTRPNDKRIFDCAVPLVGEGDYDKGGGILGNWKTVASFLHKRLDLR